MSTNLLGYGPHQITTDGDYDVKCVNIDGNRPTLLTIGALFGTFDGTFVVKTRKRGSTTAFQLAAYMKPDGSAPVSTAIAADASVQIDVTGKDVRITTAGRTTGTLALDFDVAAEA